MSPKLDVKAIALNNLQQQVTFLCGQGVALPNLLVIVEDSYKKARDAHL